ncbi:MAG: hypothetical protein Q4Q62_03275 [Thermoplasmata archaeon]|nr:hypothetical protein [Thermoplasmata archaeon]
MTRMLPFRFRLMDYLASVDEASPRTAIAALGSEYGDRKFFTEKKLVEDFLSMQANGIAEETRVTMDDAGGLECFYEITDYGRDLLDKYLPAWYTN